jgi:hypothetical protein
VTDSKGQVVASIEAAKSHLQTALSELRRLPATDAHNFGVAVHALNNYLAVAGGTVALLSDSLIESPDAALTHRDCRRTVEWFRP